MININNRLADDYCISQIPKIEEIIEPIKSFGIKYFSYSKFIGFDKYMVICPLRPITIKAYGYGQDAPLIASQLKLIEQEKKLSFWQCMFREDKILQNFRNLGINHGIALFRSPEEDVRECFHFAATSDNEQILDFYINNTDILNSFIDSFKEKMGRFLSHDISGRLYQLESPLQLDCNDDYERIKPHKKLDYLYDKTKNHKPLLTPRQQECFKLLKKGYTNKHIAMMLGRSHRTIEEHTAAILQKLGLVSRYDLIDS